MTNAFQGWPMITAGQAARSVLYAQCEGKACGESNGCGGICSTGLCPTGQVCVGGKCNCNADSCPGGCCSAAGQCITTAADTACGVGGALCKDCQAQGGQVCLDGGCILPEPAVYTECKVTAPLAAATVFNMTADAGNQRCKTAFGAEWWWGHYLKAGNVLVCDPMIASGPKCQEITNDRWWWFGAARDDAGLFTTWHVRIPEGEFCVRGWSYDSPDSSCEYWKNCTSACGDVPLICCR